jgi:large subunit ribosomal protein L25
MMENVELRAESRKIRGKKVKQLRTDDWVPAVMYGPDMPSKPIKIQERELFRALRQAGSTTLINLFLDQEAKPSVVLAREIQRDILTGALQHVDFYEVRLTEMVKTTPRLEIVGESPVVKSGIGVMIYGMNEVEVECLPTDLINSIVVDVSVLESMEDSILVGDLPVSEGVTILADPSEVVVSLVPTRAPEEEPVEEELELVEDEEEVEIED